MILHVMYGVQSHSFIIENKLYYFSVFGYCIFFIRSFWDSPFTGNLSFEHCSMCIPISVMLDLLVPNVFSALYYQREFSMINYSYGSEAEIQSFGFTLL